MSYFDESYMAPPPAAAASAAFAFGTAAARPAPAAGNANTGYYATDTGEVTFSDGTTWAPLKSINTAFAINATLSLNALQWIGGNSLQILSNGHWNSSSLDITNPGSGLMVAEGANAKQGTATLVAGTVVVANTSVTATSRIFLTGQSDGGTVGFHRVSARTAGTSFTITSSSGTDTSVVAYEIFEVG